MLDPLWGLGPQQRVQLPTPVAYWASRARAFHAGTTGPKQGPIFTNRKKIQPSLIAVCSWDQTIYLETRCCRPPDALAACLCCGTHQRCNCAGAQRLAGEGHQAAAAGRGLPGSPRCPAATHAAASAAADAAASCRCCGCSAAASLSPPAMSGNRMRSPRMVENWYSLTYQKASRVIRVPRSCGSGVYKGGVGGQKRLLSRCRCLFAFANVTCRCHVWARESAVVA